MPASAPAESPLSRSRPSASSHIALTADQQIILGGTVAPVSEEPYAAITRLTRSGELDSRFGTGGIAATRILNDDLVWATAIGVAPGTVYAAGVTYGRYLAPHQPRLALMRFDRRGRHDTSFGTDGFYLRPTFGINFATRVALLNGGDVVLGGYDAAGGYVLTRLGRK